MRVDLKLEGRGVADAFETAPALLAVYKVMRGERYLLALQPEKMTLEVVLHSQATGQDVLRALFHGTVLARMHTTHVENSNGRGGVPPEGIANTPLRPEEEVMLLEKSLTESRALFPSFEASVKVAGWQGEVTWVDQGGARNTWVVEAAVHPEP
jgi:hypothetical protein